MVRGKGNLFLKMESFFEVKEKEEILEEMEWISEMFDKIDDKMVKEKKNEENL